MIADELVDAFATDYWRKLSKKELDSTLFQQPCTDQLLNEHSRERLNAIGIRASADSACRAMFFGRYRRTFGRTPLSF